MRLVDREILRLAVPSIVSNVTVPLLGLVDLAISGHMAGGEQGGGEVYIAAISVGSMTFNVIYWLMGFLRMGTSGMTAQAYGAGDAAGEWRLLRRGVRMALAIAVAFLLLQVPIRWAALAVIHPSPVVEPLAATYFNIVIWGCPAVLTLYSLNGWFVGMQDTRAPMVVAILQNIINIIASLLFVFALHMRVAGVALGTLVAQWSGLLLALLIVRRKRRAAGAGFDAVAAGDSARTTGNTGEGNTGSAFGTEGLIFLRTVCLVAVMLTFTSAGARQGDMTLAVNTMLMTFYTLFSYVMDGFAYAGEALTGRCYGAGDRQGLRTVVGSLLWRWGLGLALLFTLLYIAGGSALVSLLTDDAAVRLSARAYQPWVWLIPLAGFGAFTYDGIFVGLTMSKGMLVSAATAAACFFTVLAAAVLSPLSAGHPAAVNHLLWAAFIVFLAMRGIIQHAILSRRGRQ